MGLHKTDILNMCRIGINYILSKNQHVRLLYVEMGEDISAFFLVFHLQVYVYGKKTCIFLEQVGLLSAERADNCCKPTVCK